MLFILLFIPGDYAGPCFIGFAIGESLGAARTRASRAASLRKLRNIGSDLMKIVFKSRDDARNPASSRTGTGDNGRRLGGPKRDGFETYGVTALH